MTCMLVILKFPTRPFWSKIKTVHPHLLHWYSQWQSFHRDNVSYACGLGLPVCNCLVPLLYTPSHSLFAHHKHKSYVDHFSTVEWNELYNNMFVYLDWNDRSLVENNMLGIVSHVIIVLEFSHLEKDHHSCSLHHIFVFTNNYLEFSW